MYKLPSTQSSCGRLTHEKVASSGGFGTDCACLLGALAPAEQNRRSDLNAPWFGDRALPQAVTLGPTGNGVTAGATPAFSIPLGGSPTQLALRRRREVRGMQAVLRPLPVCHR